VVRAGHHRLDPEERFIENSHGSPALRQGAVLLQWRKRWMARKN
jgi:hypothetical protein